MRKKPILTPRDLKSEERDYLLSIRIDDKDWLSRIENEWWGKNTTSREDWRSEEQFKLAQEALEIRKKLLLFGGSHAAVQPDRDDGNKILSRGRLFLPKGSIRKRGLPCQCHYNSSVLWDKNSEDPRFHIATGYALSKDGMWRQHSWVVIENDCSITVVETTEPREAYWGYIMNDEECKDFYTWNT